MEQVPSRIEQFNLAVRGVVTLILTGGLVWGFIYGDKISAEPGSAITGGRSADDYNADAGYHRHHRADANQRRMRSCDDYLCWLYSR